MYILQLSEEYEEIHNKFTFKTDAKLVKIFFWRYLHLPNAFFSLLYILKYKNRVQWKTSLWHIFLKVLIIKKMAIKPSSK